VKATEVKTMAREIPVYLGDPVTYTIAQLETKAHDFLKQNKAKEYKAMSQKDRNELAHLKAEAAKRYAENLMESGTPDFVAWPMAIRQEILGSESD
jgi:hypothetical protein